MVIALKEQGDIEIKIALAPNEADQFVASAAISQAFRAVLFQRDSDVLCLGPPGLHPVFYDQYRCFICCN